MTIQEVLGRKISRKAAKAQRTAQLWLVIEFCMGKRVSVSLWPLSFTTWVVALHVFALLIWLSFPCRGFGQMGAHGFFQAGWPQEIDFWQQPDEDEWDWSNYNWDSVQNRTEICSSIAVDLVVAAALLVSAIVISQFFTAEYQPVPFRERLRLHLSTAVLVCVVLAGYLYANARAQRDRYVAPIILASGYVSYGWPYQYYGALESAPGVEFPAAEARKVALSDTEEGLNGWDRLNLAKDVAVGIYLALLTMQSIEFLIRRDALENAARAGIPPGC